MEFKMQIKGLDKLMARLDKKNLDAAIVRTLNRGAVHVRSELSKNVAEVYNISPSEFKGDMVTIENAGYGGKPAVVKVKARKRIALIKFVRSMQMFTRSGRTRNRRIRSLHAAQFGSITYEVQRGKTQTMNDVVVADFGHGKTVFKRLRGAPHRKQLRALYTLSGNQAVKTSSVMENIRKDAIEYMRRVFIHELKYRAGDLG